MCLHVEPQGQEEQRALRLGAEVVGAVLGAKAGPQAGPDLLCLVDPEGSLDFVPGKLRRKLVRNPSEQVGP